jgi:hypothetical protein
MTEPVLAPDDPEDPPPAVRGERIQMTVSTRDPAAMASALRGWLAGRLALAEPPVISGVRMPPSGGLSSTSLLFEADWSSGGTREHGAFVARMAPEQSAVPCSLATTCQVSSA